MTDAMYSAFRCPSTKTSLVVLTEKGLANERDQLFPFLDSRGKVVDFLESNKPSEADTIVDYSSTDIVERYRSEMEWLFASFYTSEDEERQKVLSQIELKKGDKVLITGCGLATEINYILDLVGPSGEIHAQDLSRPMVLHAANRSKHENVQFSISDALNLPYASRYFDHVIHSGGINLFKDIRKGISEMERVCKIGGTVLFADEGIAAHLRGTEYADIAINNNRLWAAEPPIAELPHNAHDIKLTYILGNCFYVISFCVGEGFPKMNIDVPQNTARGGTMRTRYFGRLEGVEESTKQKIIDEANRRNISIHQLVEEIINNVIPDRPHG